MGLGTLFPFHGNLQENLFNNSKRTKITSCQILTKIAKHQMEHWNWSHFWFTQSKYHIFWANFACQIKIQKWNNYQGRFFRDRNHTSWKWRFVNLFSSAMDSSNFFLFSDMNGKFLFTLEVAESEVEVWWHNEYGKQTTYLLELEYPSSPSLIKQVGFR